MLRDAINLGLAMAIVAAISAGVTHFMTRHIGTLPEIVVMDVGALMDTIDQDAPNLYEEVQAKTARANALADRLAQEGFIVLDGRGVMRAPPSLTYNPVADSAVAGGLAEDSQP